MNIHLKVLSNADDYIFTTANNIASFRSGIDSVMKFSQWVYGTRFECHLSGGVLMQYMPRGLNAIFTARFECHLYSGV